MEHESDDDYYIHQESCPEHPEYFTDGDRVYRVYQLVNREYAVYPDPADYSHDELMELADVNGWTVNRVEFESPSLWHYPEDEPVECLACLGYVIGCRHGIDMRGGDAGMCATGTVEWRQNREWWHGELEWLAKCVPTVARALVWEMETGRDLGCIEPGNQYRLIGIPSVVGELHDHLSGDEEVMRAENVLECAVQLVDGLSSRLVCDAVDVLRCELGFADDLYRDVAKVSYPLKKQRMPISVVFGAVHPRADQRSHTQWLVNVTRRVVSPELVRMVARKFADVPFGVLEGLAHAAETFTDADVNVRVMSWSDSVVPFGTCAGDLLDLNSETHVQICVGRVDIEYVLRQMDFTVEEWDKVVAVALRPSVYDPRLVIRVARYLREVADERYRSEAEAAYYEECDEALTILWDSLSENLSIDYELGYEFVHGRRLYRSPVKLVLDTLEQLATIASLGRLVANVIAKNTSDVVSVGPAAARLFVVLGKLNLEPDTGADMDEDGRLLAETAFLRMLGEHGDEFEEHLRHRGLSVLDYLRGRIDGITNGASVK